MVGSAHLWPFGSDSEEDIDCMEHCISCLEFVGDGLVRIPDRTAGNLPSYDAAETFELPHTAS